MKLKPKYKKLNDAAIKDNLISRGEILKSLLIFHAALKFWKHGKRLSGKTLSDEIGVDVCQEFKRLHLARYFNYKQGRIDLGIDNVEDAGLGICLAEGVADGLLKRTTAQTAGSGGNVGDRAYHRSSLPSSQRVQNSARPSGKKRG